MGLLRRIVTLPLAPVEGVIWLTEQLERQAAEQYYGPDAIRREMDGLSAAYADGDLSPEEYEQAETDLLDRLDIYLSREGDGRP